MLKMQDVLDKVPLTLLPGTVTEEPDLEALESALDTRTNIGWDATFNIRMRAVAVNKWYCTDTWVGVYAYYFDGEFVALSFQRGRKWDTSFRWVDIMDARRVYSYIRSLAHEQPVAGLINREELIEGFWMQPQ